MLHKQKFYCQICEKACKDENGFKVHCKTPGHVNKMKVLSEDSDFYINSYSRQFEDEFLRFLRLKGMSGDTFCSSNLYQDFIKETPNHVHLNATRWTKLTNFLYSLEAKGYLKILGFSDYGKSTIKLSEKLIGNNKFNIDDINNKFNKKEKIIKEEFDEFDKIVSNSNVELKLKEDDSMKLKVNQSENKLINENSKSEDLGDKNLEKEEISLKIDLENNLKFLNKPVIRKKVITSDGDQVGSKKFNSKIDSLNSLLQCTNNILK